MPTNVVNMDNMRKHLTVAEKSARNQAESQFKRDGKVNLREPKNVRDDPLAHAHWMAIKRTIKGVKLLDDVDSDMLGIYCHLLARRERILFPDPEDKIEGDDIDALVIIKLKAHVEYMMTLERLIAQYAEKLGLTPGGRARLAKREAEKPKENKFSRFKK